MSKPPLYAKELSGFKYMLGPSSSNTLIAPTDAMPFYGMFQRNCTSLNAVLATWRISCAP
ncbi:hypothetical protein [Dyella amyloliquefaciens]|uniref:hypothetical protein n=1 Tax=Dyella amyloliquefaciens TaxID=1770545 RepID=UPI00102E40DD|nr:hypothetical protein [Dyella amyloliquefaciens]